MCAAAETIGRLVELQPDVVRLARVVSLAARIEPALLRRLRIELLPTSDAGLEADLRFSPLTRSHNASSIVLRTEVVEFLREQLAEPANRTLLDRVWQIVQAKHSSAPSIIQLEEKVTWLALRGESSAADLDSELMRAVRALAHEDRSGIAQWAARALPRLPARARKSKAAWLLAVGAAARLGGREILDASAAVDVPHELLRAVLPETNTARIGVRLLEDGIEFGDVGLPGAKLLRVPNASPVTLDLKWAFDGAAADDAPRETRAVFSLGSRKKFEPPGDDAATRGILEIQITTALGEQHILRRVHVSTALSETAEALLRRFAQPGPKRILAIDSGGVRCTIGLQFLARIEALLRERFQHLDLRLADYFDLIGGTSTGALIAAVLAMGARVDELDGQWARFHSGIFTKASFLHRLQHKFDDEGLNRGLAEILGNKTLMSSSMRTGLCLLAKRADTGAVFSLLNHPESRDFAHRSTILLRDAVRASMAAPTYFAPVPLELGAGETGIFMDTGASMMADPALHLLLVARVGGHPFRWKTGEQNLLLVSIGSGITRKPPSIEAVKKFNLVDWAGQIPSMLVQNGRAQAQRLLRQLARTLPTGSPGEMPPARPLGGTAQLTYARFDVGLDPAWLSELGLSELASRAESLHASDDPDRLSDYIALGRAAASRQVNASHFPPNFDPDFQSADSPNPSRTARKSAETKS